MNKLVNFRDLGGFAAAGGKKVQFGRLFRAAAPVGLSAEEVATLKRHGLVQIIDFRSQPEVSIAPADKIDGAAYVNLDVLADKLSNTSVSDPEEWLDRLSFDTVDEDMKNIYRDFIFLSSAQKGFADFVRVCANTGQGAILFNCAAGKDRTGFAAAIILKILGVSDEDIYADYLKTLEGREEANARLIKDYRAKGLTEDKLMALGLWYGIKREYLAAAFVALEEEYGSFERYMEHCLGILPADVLYIRELYLEMEDKKR